MADDVAPLSGHGVMDHVSDLLQLNVETKNLDSVPEKGRVIIAPTHPTGIADGIAIWDALRQRRPDMAFFANRDAVRAAPQLEGILIPVEWVEEKRTRQRSRETLIATRDAFNNEQCIVLFPSGRISYMNENKVLTEQEWLSSVAILAKKYDAAIVPAKITARNSWLYYWFWKLNEELRDMTLFHELLNKKQKRYDLVFGNAIPADQLGGDATDVTAALQSYTVNDMPEGKPWVPI